MKTVWFCIFLLWILSGCYIYNPILSQPHDTNTLKFFPDFIQCDSARVRQLYLAGTEDEIQRIPYWDSLLTNAFNCNYPFYQCKILGTIAHIYGTRNDFPQAVLYANKALSIAEAQGYKTELIPLIKKLEHLSSLQLKRQQSLYFIYKGLKIAEELHDKRAIADFYSFVGLYYYTSGEFDKALQVHFQCLMLCKNIGYDFGVSSALVDIGTDYICLKQPEKAIPYYLESKKYLGKLEGTIYAVQIYNSISSAYNLKHEFDSAYYYNNKALKIAKNIDSKIAVASSLEIVACTDYYAGNYHAAIRHALQALALARSTNFIAQMPSLLQLIKNIYLKSGNYKEAMKAYELYVNINDSFSNEKIRKLAIEKEYTYRLEKKENAYTLLSQQSQIQKLKLLQQSYLASGLAILVLVVLVITYLVIRHNRFRAEHQRVQLEQKLLRMQMNPHFLFNSMNSIQQLIMSGKNRPAELYLSKFSKLIRDLLESNTKEGLTVQEETGMLYAYLQMEALRFSNNFSYVIDVDRQLNAAIISIPHLMIQPFVENAIWHGLLAKEQNRCLQVSIGYDTEKTIKCIIDDNGIGRVESMKKTASLHKKSLALDLVKQRIDLIKKTHKISGSIQITDKKDAAGNSLGTTVVLILPILNHELC